MAETLSEYDKWYIILELRISAFSASINLENCFPTLTAGFDGVGHIYSWFENVFTGETFL